MKVLIAGTVLLAVSAGGALSQGGAPLRARDIVKEFDADRKRRRKNTAGNRSQ